MKAFVLFAPAFMQLPLAVIRWLSDNHEPTLVSGLVTGSRKVVEVVKRVTDIQIESLDYVDDLERQWLQIDDPLSRLRQYEDRLGSEVVKRIVLADRRVGAGFVSGATIASSSLQRLCRDDPNIQRYVVGLIDYAFDVLRRENPDIVFCYTVAGAPACALAIVAKHLRIQFARISSTHVRSRFAIDTTVELSLKPISDIYQSNWCKTKEAEPFVQEASRYLVHFQDKPVKYEASKQKHRWFLESLRVRRLIVDGWYDLRAVASETLRKPRLDCRRAEAWRLASENISIRLKARRLMHGKVFKSPGFRPRGKFVLFPLHVEPEAATMVLAPYHAEQTSIIDALARSIPLSMSLLVKEHIPMLGRRKLVFYDRLARIPGVILISPFEDTFALIKQAALTCGITSTAVWEAMQLQRPALSIGRTHFVDVVESVDHCPNLATLPQALESAMKAPTKKTDKLRDYIACILAHSFDLPMELFRAGVTQEQVEARPDVIRNIGLGLLSVLDYRQ